MKPILTAFAVLAVAATALPALAQNAGQIARVRGGASCPGCNLFQGDFGGLEARGLNNASFVGTYLEGSNFSRATLDGTNFSGAQLGRATGLTQAQLNRACGDSSTILPTGLRIPAC